MTGELYDIYEEEAPSYLRGDTVEKFTCECGSERRVDQMTECKKCGAHYVYDEDEGMMKQIAPPIGEVGS